MYFNIEVGILD